MEKLLNLDEKNIKILEKQYRDQGDLNEDDNLISMINDNIYD